MLGSNQTKKQGAVKGCLIPILGLVGFIAGCYLLCSGLFVLNGGQLSFAAPKPTAIPAEIPADVPPTPEETPTPSSFIFQPAALSYRLQVASYPLTLSNCRS